MREHVCSQWKLANFSLSLFCFVVSIPLKAKMSLKRVDASKLGLDKFSVRTAKKGLKFSGEGRTFLLTLGAERTSVRSSVRPSKRSSFCTGSSLRNRMKRNMCTYLEHACISILTLKMHIDYKRIFTHHTLQVRFLSRIFESFSEASLNLYVGMNLCFRL